MTDKTEILEHEVNYILDEADIHYAGTLEERLHMMLIKYKIALLEVDRLKLELDQYE